MAIILIAEDEKGMQTIIADYMKRGGHTCITADDGIDAISILKNNSLDLAILDIMMPEFSGLEVVKILREKTMMPILILSARDQDEDKILGLDIGADDYLTKPFNP